MVMDDGEYYENEKVRGGSDYKGVDAGGRILMKLCDLRWKHRGEARR
jgi:hypothetical protein